MNGALYILKFLEQQGCTNAYGYPGGAIMPLYDALLDSNITHYLARHEQGAAFAAIGHARSTNQVGVCFGTSGPGATNLITSIADAKLDSVPLLVITGQVARPAMGSDAFQEVDVLGLSLSVTKHSMIVQDIAELPSKLAEAYQIAQEGRPGPVLVDVPKDVLLTECPAEIHLVELSGQETESADLSTELLAQIERANQLMQTAQKPLLYIGGGVSMAGAIEEFREFLANSGLPAVSTLKGLGTIPKDYEFNLGMLGMHGWSCANHAVQQCDLLIVVGARLDDRATGKLDEFAPLAKVIHIDVDAAELHKRRFADVAIACDVKPVFSKLKAVEPTSDWKKNINSLQKRAEKHYAIEGRDSVDAESLLHYISETMSSDTVVTADVGQHQMWVAQHMNFAAPTHHLTSGGLGTMGFGMPAAIGAKLANPNKPVVAVCGDGSFMMNIQELATIKRYNIPVKILVLDNQRLGMVKQWQELFHEERYSETDLSDNPEFSSVAQAFGVSADVLSRPQDVRTKIGKFLASPSAMLLHVKLSSLDNVWPIVPPNTANDKMMERPDAIQS